MIVAVGVLGLLGGIFFAVLNSGMVLYAKNTAVNVAHAEAKDAVLRLTRDIHASVSVPQLRDENFAVVSSQPAAGASPTPPVASGVSFQNISSGPNYIWKDPGNVNLIMIKDSPNQPIPGQHLVIPFWGSLFEQDITKVTAGGAANHSNVFLANGYDTNINPRLQGGAYAITYYTDRVMYLVQNGHFVLDTSGLYTTISGNNGAQNNFYSTADFKVAPAGTASGKLYRYENGEVHLYKQRYTGSAFYWQDQAATGIARNITSPYPFYVPLNTGGSPNTKYVGVNLSASDPKSSNRGYVATNSLLSTTIDYRASITLTQ
jgi:hypothetical protein